MAIDVLFPNQQDVLNDQSLQYTSVRSSKAATIKIIGVGGAGVNAVNRMINAKLSDVEFYVVNTDSAVLKESLADNKVQIGVDGLGVGGDPEKGRKAALDSIDDLKDVVSGADMIFIATGMGGGTGTGAAPIIAKIAKEMGILNVGVVTKPFSAEGKIRCEHAEKGIKEIKQYVDTLVVIPNDRAYTNIDDKTPLRAAFKIIDDVLRIAIESITDTITKTGNIINIDFADVKAVLTNSINTIIGLGIGETYEDAFNKALTNVFVEGPDIREATNVLINVSSSNINPFTIGNKKILDACMAKEFKKSTFNKIGAIEENSLDKKIKVSIIASFNKPKEVPDDLFSGQIESVEEKHKEEQKRKNIKVRNDVNTLQDNNNVFAKPAYEFWTIKHLK